MILKFKNNILFSILLLSEILVAQAPASYYYNARGKKDAELKTALHSIIRPHTILEYYASATYFKQTDWNPDGYFWDMYSNIKRTAWSGMNREHSLPKSWWSASPETTDAYSDLHNLYPSDATANTAKSNYALGEVTGTPDFSNGVVKVGTNGYTGYAGKVFEPADEYKGDFARDYMYVVTCYEDYTNDWRSTGTESMLNRNNYPTFKPYAVSLLLKWHRSDPVSEKETNRNNAVYSLQGNRNPFIDFPVLAEYLWGKFAGEEWTGDASEPVDFYVSYQPEDKILYVSVYGQSAATYKIFGVDGVLNQQGSISTNKTIDVNSLKQGMYIILIYYNGLRKSTKFVVP